MKDELCGKIMTEFVALRAKTCSYLDYDDKRKIKYEDYKKSLFDNNPVLRSQEVSKSEFHDVYTLKINKVALSSNDDKRLQTYDKITTYPYGSNVGKVCKAELLNKGKQID